ncbi:MAG: hypothetical protein ACLR2E_05630 [Lachnospiraceae bacterium]
MSGFLPITKKEMRERGITQFDFVYVIGDAYVDHPSFGHASSSAGFWSPMATAWGSSLSPTGKR